jgi:hypothetical protein
MMPGLEASAANRRSNNTVAGITKII